MNSRTANRWDQSGRRAPGPELLRLLGVWSRLSAGNAPWLFASDRYVGDRPLSGKETGMAAVAHCGSWEFSHYERLGNRAIDCHCGQCFRGSYYDLGA